MLIDWFTVSAQVLNFLILVWLLKRFLYHPILDAIDARERRIAAELAAADAKMAEASAERETFERKNIEFAREKAALLDAATAAANNERLRLLDEARSAVAELTAKRGEDLRGEAQRLDQEIYRRTHHEVFAIARKALGDLAGTTLEARMVEVFAGRLQELSATEQNNLRAALQASGAPVVVRSAFELPAAQRTACEAAVRKLLGENVAIHFETAENLVSGIELLSDGYKVGWSIAEYLATLEKSVGQLLTTASKKPEDKADAH